MKHLFAIRALNRSGRLFASAFILAAVSLQQLRAQSTVSDGSAVTFGTTLDEVVSNGGGTILVTTPVVIDPTNGPLIFDGVSNVVVSGGNTNSIFVVPDGGDLDAFEHGAGERRKHQRPGGRSTCLKNGTAAFNNCIFSNNLALGVIGLSGVVVTNTSTNTVYIKYGGDGYRGNSHNGAAARTSIRRRDFQSGKCHGPGLLILH